MSVCVCVIKNYKRSKSHIHQRLHWTLLKKKDDCIFILFYYMFVLRFSDLKFRLFKNIDFNMYNVSFLTQISIAHFPLSPEANQCLINLLSSCGILIGGNDAYAHKKKDPHVFILFTTTSIVCFVKMSIQLKTCCNKYLKLHTITLSKHKYLRCKKSSP